MSTIGIVANPESGKDIRRLIAAASVSANSEKVKILTRLLVGMETTGVSEVFMMPDSDGIGWNAKKKFSRLQKSDLTISFLDMELFGSEFDSYRAAKKLNEMNVDLLITLGGDGTNRIVAKGCGQTPMLPLSTGTNNVFPYMMEGTIAGMAAGMVAGGAVDHDTVIVKRKKIEVLKNDEVLDIALVDAAVTSYTHIGSKAVWETDTIKQIVQTCGSLNNIGLSAIGGCLCRISDLDGGGLHVELGDGNISVLAPIAPGLIEKINVKSVEKMAVGDRVPIRYNPSVVAVDGERQVTIRGKGNFSMRLSGDGPRVVDVPKVLELATDLFYFRLDNGSRVVA